MADPHRKERYGETWPQYKIDAYLEVLEALKCFIVLSGGWAWHFLSPDGHIEYKHAHDHKDLDLMVPKWAVGSTMGVLSSLNFEKVATRYDRFPSEEEFRRYEKVVAYFKCPLCKWHGSLPARREWGDEPPCPQCNVGSKDISFRLTIDFFVRNVPAVKTRSGFLVVDPGTLLGFYSTIHSSKSCWAVVAAKKLMERGVSLEGHPDLCKVSSTGAERG